MNFLKLLNADIKEQILEQYMKFSSLVTVDELEEHFQKVFACLSEQEQKQIKALLRRLRKWKGIGDHSAKELLLRVGQLWAASEEIWRKEKAEESEKFIRNKRGYFP